MSKTNKCKLCKKHFTSEEGLYTHLEGKHGDEFPKEYTGGQIEYFLRTGKGPSKCIICGTQTDWNPKTNKYYRICGKPSCKEEIRRRYEQNMMKVHGKTTLLDDPEQQRKLLASRKISGKYKFSDGKELSYVGSYERKFLEFLDTVMEWNSNDILTPSPQTFEYIYQNKKHFYIPDMYIISLDLNLEIKDGGFNPNMHHSIQADIKKKEAQKDKVMMTQKCSYLKVYNNNFRSFLAFLLERKKQIASGKVKPIHFIVDVQRVLQESVNFANLSPVIPTTGSPLVKKYEDMYEDMVDKYSDLNKDLLREEAIGKASLSVDRNKINYIPEDIRDRMKLQYEHMIERHKSIREKYDRDLSNMATLIEEIKRAEDSGLSIFKYSDLNKVNEETCPNGFYFLNERTKELKWNSIKWIDGRPYRERVAVIVFNEDNTKIYCQLNDKPEKLFQGLMGPRIRYRIPGGSVEPTRTNEEQVVQECREEIRYNVTDVKGPYETIISHTPLSKHKIDYDGCITHLYTAKVDSKYDGHVKEIEKDMRMTIYGRFYPIKDIEDLLYPEHKKIIDEVNK